MSETYIATVHLVVRADGPSEAADAISACLSENLGCEVNGADNPGLVDWSYQQVGEIFPGPSTIELPKHYNEGDFLFAMETNE